jgi:Flp pilus assembly pilin Flp
MSRAFLHRGPLAESGQTMGEYVVLLSVITAAIVLAVGGLSTAIHSALELATDTIQQLL